MEISLFLGWFLMAGSGFIGGGSFLMVVVGLVFKSAPKRHHLAALPLLVKRHRRERMRVDLS